MVVEALSWWSRRASQHPVVQSSVHPWKSPTNLARSLLHVALVGRKMAVVRDQLFPQKLPGSRFRFSRTGVKHSPGSSKIELPSAFAESGAYPPDRELPGSPRQCSLPLACRHPPEGHQVGARKRRTPENTILSQTYCRRVSTDRPNRKGSQLAASLEGEPGRTPAEKILSHSYPETRFRRQSARDDWLMWKHVVSPLPCIKTRNLLLCSTVVPPDRVNLTHRNPAKRINNLSFRTIIIRKISKLFLREPWPTSFYIEKPIPGMIYWWKSIVTYYQL